MKIHRPPEGETSIGHIYRLWRAGKMPLSDALLNALQRIPATTYPLGEQRYWDSVNENPWHLWHAPHNRWHMAQHFALGFIVGSVFGFWGFVLFTCLAVTLELNDWRLQKFRWYSKNTSDILDRSLGALIGFLVWL